VTSSPGTAASWMRSALDWLASLTPWPEEFGLGGIRALLAALGDPQLQYPSVHVVGTNGKTTTVRLTEALLAAEGLEVGAYTSPHVTTWAERIRVGGAEADVERALDRVRTDAERLGATQFEVLTAAALAEFASAGVDVAVVEAGLGGRYDATNVLRSPVQVLTNVALDHTDVLGDTRRVIAAEKLAVVQRGATVVLGEAEWAELARANGAAAVVTAGRSNLALALAAAESLLGRPVDASAAEAVHVPGRLEHRSEAPLEIWDGAHNLAGIGYLLPRLPARRYVVVASILDDKDVDGMLAALSVVGETVVATRSGNPRSLPAGELAVRARRWFERVEAVQEPAEALTRARELAGPDGAVLVVGSLYLLADLFARGPVVLHRDVT
jgi:dihydrofolate synthase / folylpolyglutamate synthase